ncbi:palmitoyltransferase akr1, partial [Aureobasidium melanogenum]
MVAMSKSSSPEPPPFPGDDHLVQPDHAAAAASVLQTTAATITNDLFKFQISTSDPRGLVDTKPSTNKSNDLPKAKPSIKKPRNKTNCTNCGNLDAKAHCSGCHGAPEVDGTFQTGVRYCNKECQKAHWPHHRRGCKNMQDRKALFRAGSLLQKIWYMVRRESFDNCVVKAEEVNGELLIHEGNYGSEPTIRENGFYREFPDAIFESKQDAETCLILLCCAESLSHMYMVTSWLLKNICAEIKETTVKVVKADRRSRYVSQEWGGDFLHEVLQVHLNSGERYAIDLTGAQYGWFDKPITEWGEFTVNCVEVIRSTPSGIAPKGPLGFNARSILMLAFSDPWDNRSDGQRAVPMFNECLRRQFNKEFIEQVISKHDHGSDVLKLPISAFEAVEKDILLKTKQITYNTAKKIDAIWGLIQNYAQLCNNIMRENPDIAAASILKHALIDLAAFFNGEWARDTFTGRLTSISYKRFLEDEDYKEKFTSGRLPEQKLWGDLTLEPAIIRLQPDVLAALKKENGYTLGSHNRDMANKEGSAPSSRERPAAITTPSAPTSNGNGHLELDDMPSSPIHPIQEDLMALARLGELRSIQKLFDSGKASATSADPQGITALHWAAINGHYALCHYLIESGANVNAKGGDAEATPVLWASKRCHLDVVNLLLQQGADPLLTDDQGYNLLHSATLDGNVFQLILLLHQADVPVDIPDSQGHTSLMWAAYKGFPACLDVLLKWGADVHARDDLGFTALHWALVKGSYNCIQKLLEYGADRFVANNDGKTPAVTAKDMNSTRQWHRALSDCGFDSSGNPRSFPLTFIKDTRKFLDRFFFAWPFVVIGITLYILSIMPVYFGLPISMITSYLLQLASQKLLKWAPSDMKHMHKTPFLAGVFAATLAWVGVRYITHILPTTFTSHFFLNLFFVAAFGLCAYYYFTAMLMDPGYIPRSASRGQQKATIEELIDAKAFDEQHFCTMCMIRKPLRSKHCRRCNRCVARHDHHCPWLNNCVGVNNHRAFVLYIIFLLIGIALLIRLTLVYLELLPTPPASSIHCEVLKEEFCAQWSKDPFTLLVNGWGSIQMTWTIMLLFVQLTQIARAMTTWEAMRNNHAGPLVTALTTGSTSQEGGSIGSSGGGPTTGTPRHNTTGKESCFAQWKRILGVDTFVATALYGSRAQEVLAQRRENPFTKGIMRNCGDFWFDGEGGGVGSMFGGK